MAKDYSYLEGLPFVFFNGREELNAKVLYAEYDVGLTCINIDDPDDYLICLIGPTLAKDWSKKGYKALWDCLINGIKNGYVTSRDSVNVFNKYEDSLLGPGSSPASEDCAFGQ